MSEKDEALQHLSAIKSALVDKDSFFPYNYNALIVWGLIGMFLTMVLPSVIKESVWQGSALAFIMTTIGFVVEGFLTKRVNADYDIESCTKKQRFIVMVFTVGTLFSLALSAILAQYDLIIPLFAIWMFACGIGDLAVGYVLNMKIFVFQAFIMIGASLLVLLLSYFMGDLGNLESAFFYFAQGLAFATMGVLPIMIAMKLKKDS